MLHFLNDIANDAESTKKLKDYIMIANFKSETMGNLINKIPGSPLLVSSLPGSALRTHVESLGKPCELTSILKAEPGKLDIKIHSPSILYLQCQDQSGIII